MHKYNCKETIGYDFYDTPQSSRSLRLEFVFNRIFGILPITIGFSDEFEMACLDAIKEHFELFSQDIHQVGDKLLEEGVWIGKQGTAFKDALLGVNYRSQAGNTTVFDITSIGEEFSMAGLRGVGRSESNQAALLKNMYVTVRVACHDDAQVTAITDMLNAFKLQKKSKIYILTNNYGELDLTALPIEKTEVDLALNYGDDFLEFHDKIVNSLNNKNSGLYLFYGEPGTGKSSYIKHLLGGEINRKIVYIPIALIDRLVSPDMLPLLMENKDLILVMEDAEKALLSREESGDSLLVSSILNLTDGFIGQAMNISIIATFNTAREKIDPALLRKGRLRLSYEFCNLTVEQGKKLASSVGIDSDKINREMSLADIYYLNEDTNYSPKEERVIGFGS
jgi:hypothetical protein